VVLSKLVRELNPGKVVVFAGAAISIAAPTSLPAVANVYGAFSDYLVAGMPTLGDASELKEKLLARAPFEKLMESLYVVLRESASAQTFIPDLLQELYGHGEPNVNHESLVQMLNDGEIETIITTNFDDMLCKASPSTRRVVKESDFQQLSTELNTGGLERPTVAHVHGSTEVPGSLVALMSQVGKPLEGARRTFLECIQQGRTIVFVGYSGSDEDIWPRFSDETRKNAWWLVRELDPTTKRNERVVELVPPLWRPRSTGDVLLRRLAELSRQSPGDAQKIVAVASLLVGAPDEAIATLSALPPAQQTPAVVLALSDAYQVDQHYEMAVKLLRVPPSHGHPLYARWIVSRAFAMRHAGRLGQAVREFAALRERLESIPEAEVTTGDFADMIRVATHEIESMLLIGATKLGSSRRRVLQHCERLLDQCEAWLAMATELPPVHDISFYRAEVALFKGQPAVALEHYRAFRPASEHWNGTDPANALIGLREAVAYSGAGHRKDAAQAWLRGLKAAKRIGAFSNVIQYLVASPIIIGVPLHWYWVTRRFAVFLYPVYGTIKRQWIRLRAGISLF
jgi:hypothetical protein